MFHQEWDFVGANFEHGAGSFDFVGTVAETGIEESGIVDAEFAVGRIEGTISAANREERALVPVTREYKSRPGSRIRFLFAFWWRTSQNSSVE